jgi:hypothetical protein
VSTDNRLSEYDGAGHLDVPEEMDAEDLAPVDLLTARDDATAEWRAGLDIPPADIEDREATGQYRVDGALAVLAVHPDREAWRGWCNCDRPVPCRHLAALAQLDAIDDLHLPEVSDA